MKKTRIFLAFVALSMIICPAAFASGEPDSSTAEVIDLELWTLSSRKEFSELAIPVFLADNPGVTMTYSFNSGNDQMTNLKVGASSGTLPELWFNWGGTLASFYVENDLSYDLADYATKNNWGTSLFSQSALDLATFDGKLGGYPTAMNAIGIFYRKDIFAKSGLTVPTTFEEFENAMAVLKAEGYIPLTLCGLKGFHSMRYVEALIEMYAGSDLKDKLYNFTASWDTPEVIQAYTKFKEHVDLGYFPEGFVTLDPNDAKSFLYADEGVMDIEGPWMENNILADGQDPELYGYFKLPLSSKGNRMSGFIEMIQLNAKLSDAELDMAVKFCNFAWSPASAIESDWAHLVKQPIPRLDNILPANLPMSALMVKDATEYGTYTISDQGLPQEVVNNFFYEAQDTVALGSRTPAEAAAFMETSIKGWLASQ